VSDGSNTVTRPPSTTRQGRLIRVLKRREVLALAFGAMIGWSWVALAGTWLKSAGSVGAVSAFLIGGAVIAFIGLTYAELASAMPLVGGEHTYSLRALGPGPSFVCTWAIIFGYVSVVAFEVVALPTVMEYLFPNFKTGYLWTVAGYDVYFSWVLVGVVGAILMTTINVVGIKMAAVVQTAVTLVILLAGVVVVSGAAVGGSAANMQPLEIGGVNGMLTVLVMVPFLLVGFDVIPQAAEEIDLPYREIGAVLVISVLMAVAWYVLIILGVSLSLDSKALGAASLATADAATAAWGRPLIGKIVVVSGIAGILTSWNAFLVGGSRAIYALAHGGMLPRFLGHLHPRFNTPANAVVLVGGLAVFAPLFGRQTLVWLVDAGGFGIVIAYAMVALSFIVLRRREPEMARPYRVRYGTFVGYAALVLSIGMMVLYLPGSPSALLWPQEWVILLSGAVIGAVFYVWARLSRG
jgi:APA family basic amino acid/polyamine antiporter